MEGFHRFLVNQPASFRCWGERRRLRKTEKWHSWPDVVHLQPLTPTCRLKT